MDIPGFIYYRTSELLTFLSQHIPFSKKYGNTSFVAKGMGYDNVSPSRWKRYSKDKEGLLVDYVRFRTLELLAEEIKKKGLTGAVAELGVFRGDFSSIINQLYPESTLYLFDTFEGFADVDIKHERENDYTSDKALTQFRNTSIDIVLSKMQHPDKCVVRKGYFPETVEGLEDRFIFVSLDCDLYLPILAGLEYFYPRLVEGGYIMIHDYNPTNEWKGVKEAVNDFEKKYGFVPKVPITDSCGTLIITK
ncbi:MAG: hypothetical protein IJE95_03170 [Methanocorpusculum sp.]|nr:hypothetical protein [Methanocorpusculum sp.]